LSEPSPRSRDRSTISLRIPPFVGRAEELASFQRWLDEAVAGRPRVVLVEGDAGIGKTRLVQEVRGHAGRRGMQVGFGRCYEDLALPCLPFVESLRPLVDGQAEYVRRALGAEFEPIDQMLHRVDTAPSASHPSMVFQADHERLQLLLAVGHLVVALARRSPTLFIIDDLHWADRLSVDLFEHLAFTVADTAERESVSLLIVASYRPSAATRRLGRLRARLNREEVCRTVALSGLKESEVTELLDGLGVRRPSHQLTATMSDTTRGNPLFIQEMLHHLIRKDALQRQGGYVVASTGATELRLPDQVTAAIVGRTGSVSEPCQQALTLASFLGDAFNLKVLAAVSGIDEVELLGLLEEAMRHDLVRSEAHAFHFAHPLVRHVFYHEPSTPRRQRLHKEVGERLRDLYAADLDSHLLEVAHHLVRAGPAADARAVADCARRAADQASMAFAWTDAARYYEAALSAAAASNQLAAQERADLHYWAGLAYYYDQDIGPCLHHYDQAIEAYRTTGDVSGLARTLLEKTRTQFTLATVPLGTVPDLKPLEEVLGALGQSEPGLRGHIAAVMAEAYRNGRQAAPAKHWGREALEIARRLQDDHLSAYAGFALGLAHMNDLDVVEALQTWERALIDARRGGDFIREGWILHRTPVALTLLGRLDEADTVAVQACDATRRSHDWSSHSLGLSHQASVAVARGDFELTEGFANETMLMVSRSHYPWGAFRSLLALASARTLRGAWSEAQDALDILEEPGRVFEDAGPVVRTFANIFRELVRVYAEDDHGATAPLTDDLIPFIGTDTYSLAPLCALIELSMVGRARVSVDFIAARLASAAARGVLFSSGWMFLVPRALGLAAVARKEWSTAETHFSDAIEAGQRSGARPELARTYLDYARMLSAQGGDANRRKAVELLTLAAPLFVELQMQPFAAQAATLGRTLGIEVPTVRPRPTVYLDDLNEREVDVLMRIAHGRSRHQIAGDLVLGAKTITGHLRNIFDKVNVGDDAAARAYAVAAGLAPGKSESGVPEQALRIILVTDIVASGALIRRSGDARAHDVMQRHNALIRECLAVHNGVEVLHTGDGIEASFQVASDAVECAIAIQRKLVTHNRVHPNDPIHVRIGINAGEPIVTEGRLFGAAVHAAFGICARARAGTVLISESVSQLAAGERFVLTPRGRLGLKGLGRTRVYEVTLEEQTT
jgi:class 3 adenylate cyclase/tetratricopeptide (TPR) repeat protein